jgi:probable lipoprotein NlpC
MGSFFQLKTNETLLVNMLLVSTLFLLSCASPKHTSVRHDTAITVVETARKYIGTPYKYGGTTRAGMDCSGLLLNSFRSINMDLPRSSEDQSKVGKEVSMHELQPGDLVFFATGKKRKKITHVGLVTDVVAKDNIKFIHSSSALGVVETNLYAEYYQKRFITARRIIE